MNDDRLRDRRQVYHHGAMFDLDLTASDYQTGPYWTLANLNL